MEQYVIIDNRERRESRSELKRLNFLARVKLYFLDLIGRACVRSRIVVPSADIPGLAQDVFYPFDTRLPDSFVRRGSRFEIDRVTKRDFLKRIVFVSSDNVSE